MCFSDALFYDNGECCILQYSIAIIFLGLAIYSANKILSGYASHIKKYGYFGKKGPLEWGRIYPDALGKRQSPINVISDEVCCIYPSPELRSFPLTFQGYDRSPLQFTLHNDGIKAVLTGKWRVGTVPYITGGPLGCVKFFFSSLNFRWGPTDGWGSEHMLNYKRFPLELQLVHRIIKSTSPEEECQPTSDSVCVISYFFRIVHHDNQYLNPIIHRLGRIQSVGSKVWLQPFPLEWLATPFSYEYFTYPGSLTEPPCNEVAIWVLKFFPTICISKRQLEAFRRLRSAEGPIMVNSRPVQNINGRAVGFYAQE